MKFTKNKYILLIIPVLLTVIYSYFFVDDVQSVYKVKPLILVLVLLGYLIFSKEKNKELIFAFFFLFCETIFTFFANNELIFIQSLGCALLFILMNMVIVTKMIGQITITRFLKIMFPTALVSCILAYFLFKGGEIVTLLFYVFTVVIALYISFSIYLYILKKDKSSLLNLIAVMLFIFSAATRALSKMYGKSEITEILNIIFFTSYLCLIAKAVIIFNDEKIITA